MKLRHVSGMAVAIALGWCPVASAEDLRDALAAAYSNNPDLLAQRAALRALDEDVSNANAGFRPTVSGRIDANYQDSQSDFFASEAVPGTDPVTGDPIILPEGTLVNESELNGIDRTYSGEVRQPIFRGLRTLNTKREAESRVRAGRANLSGVEQRVLTDGVTAYMDVVRDISVLQLNENNVQVLRRQLQASQDRFRVGEITRTDVAQSEARLAGAISQRIQAEADLEASRSAYQRVIGRYPGTLDPPPPLPEVPATLDEAEAIGLDESPTVISARFTEEAARRAVNTAKGGVLPTIDATAGIQWRRGPVNFGDFTADIESRAWQAGVTMTVPLYQAGGEYATVRRAKQVRSQRMLEIASAERQVIESVRVAWEQYRAARASIESNSAQVRANEIALEGVRQEAAVGSRTTLDVLDAEQELLDSRVNLVRAERNEYVAAFSLLAAIGRLSARGLELDVEYYDPQEYYRDVRGKLIGWGTDDE